MVMIDGDRLLRSLHELRTFGAAGTGVVRPMFSDTDLASRHWLVDQMSQAGLDASVDGIGTVFGRSKNPGPTVLLGSHTDTQPEGGWLDGALGVMYGIEVARALREDPATSDLSIDVASWADEEGSYSSCIGSHSFVGDDLTPLLDATNRAGESVRNALVRSGLSTRPRAQIERSRHCAYIEAHIEQGPHLEATGRRIGVVTSIVGIRAIDVDFRGQQNHAGSTPMPDRRDAGVALFDFGVRLRKRLTELAGPTSVWTIGDMRLHPGAESIIPGHAWCRVQFRDPSDNVMSSFHDAIVALAHEMTREGPVEVNAQPARDALAPAHMDATVREVLGRAAQRHVPGEWVDMPSAAVHDANVLSEHLPTGMLFIPSIGGVSHDFAEDTSEADIVTGCQVLATAVADLLHQQR